MLTAASYRDTNMTVDVVNSQNQKVGSFDVRDRCSAGA